MPTAREPMTPRAVCIGVVVACAPAAQQRRGLGVGPGFVGAAGSAEEAPRAADAVPVRRLDPHVPFGDALHATSG